MAADEPEVIVEAEETIEGLIVATVTKESPDSKVGISLKKFGTEVIISNIAKDGLFGDTDLKIGLTLLDVNGTSCEGLSIVAAIALFKEAPSDITVRAKETAGLVCETVVKESADSKVGISLVMLNGNVIVSGISDTSLFAGTAIVPGIRLLSVNKTSFKTGISKEEAIVPFKESEGPITVLAEDLGYVCGSVVKESVDSKVGISLKEYSGGGFIISSIAKGGLFDETELTVGLRLVSVNTISPTGLDKKDAIGLFKKAEGKINVMAESVGLVVASSIKETAETTVGIALRDFEGKIVISGISEKGIFAGSELKPGLELVSVNKTNVAGMTKMEAIKLFKEAEGLVTVFAEDIGVMFANGTKEADDSIVGIALRDYDGSIFINSVSETGIFAGSGLKSGLKLVGVNKTDVTAMFKMEAIAQFKDAPAGVISVMAQDVGLAEDFFAQKVKEEEAAKLKAAAVPAAAAVVEKEDAVVEKEKKVAAKEEQPVARSMIAERSIAEMPREEVLVLFEQTVGLIRLEV